MMLILMLIMMLKFCVKESSNLIGLEHFGAAGFFITVGVGWCLSPISQKANFQQQNKSIFLRNLYKIFCLWCTFLQELVIHDHGGFLQAEKC